MFYLIDAFRKPRVLHYINGVHSSIVSHDSIDEIEETEKRRLFLEAFDRKITTLLETALNRLISLTVLNKLENLVRIWMKKKIFPSLVVDLRQFELRASHLKSLQQYASRRDDGTKFISHNEVVSPRRRKYDDDNLRESIAESVPTLRCDHSPTSFNATQLNDENVHPTLTAKRPKVSTLSSVPQQNTVDTMDKLTFLKLPEELIYYVMSFLPLETLQNLARCNSYLKRLSGDYTLWRTVSYTHHTERGSPFPGAVLLRNHSSAKCWPLVHTFDLAWCPNVNNEVVRLIIQNCLNIEVLLLHGAGNLSDEAWAPLSTSTKNITSIKTTTTVPFLNHLRILGLSCCTSLTSLGLKRLLKHVKNTLEEIDISFCPWVTPSVTHLLLRRCTALHTLRLACCHQGIFGLLESSHSRLSVLDLSCYCSSYKQNLLRILQTAVSSFSKVTFIKAVGWDDCNIHQIPDFMKSLSSRTLPLTIQVQDIWHAVSSHNNAELQSRLNGFDSTSFVHNLNTTSLPLTTTTAKFTIASDKTVHRLLSTEELAMEINMRGVKGRTPLMLACASGNIEAIRQLLTSVNSRSVINVYARDAQSWSALLLCSSLTVASFFLQHLPQHPYQVYYESEKLMLEMIEIAQKPNHAITSKDAEKMLMFLERVKHTSEVAKRFAEWIRTPSALEIFISQSQHDLKRRELIDRTLNRNAFFNTLAQYWDRATQQTILLTLGKYDFEPPHRKNAQ
jgi:hypothetical protein